MTAADVTGVNSEGAGGLGFNWLDLMVKADGEDQNFFF